MKYDIFYVCHIPAANAMEMLLNEILMTLRQFSSVAPNATMAVFVYFVFFCNI